VLVGLIFIAVPSTLKASEWNRATTAIFNHPVQVPGYVLPAGIYVFKIAEISGERNVVQIWNADETVLVATVMGWPDYLREGPSKSLFVFEEREKGAPVALKSWFHEGNPSGQTFIYRKKGGK
jgi:hypothetical protein